MTETVKNALKITITILVVVAIITTVAIVEGGRHKTRTATAVANAAYGKSVEITGQPWNVIPFTTNNGNCYNLYHRGTWTFALPCVE